MRRPIIQTNTSQKINSNIISNKASITTVELEGLALEKRLRQKRSFGYINEIKKLDAGGVTCNYAQLNELKQAIQREFPELKPVQFPIGIIAKCYLGKPYEVHTLDVKLEILEHYKKGESLPSDMNRGKRLALHPSYEFIEIFNTMLRAVTKHGDVAVIKG